MCGVWAWAWVVLGRAWVLGTRCRTIAYSTERETLEDLAKKKGIQKYCGNDDSLAFMRSGARLCVCVLCWGSGLWSTPSIRTNSFSSYTQASSQPPHKPHRPHSPCVLPCSFAVFAKPSSSHLTSHHTPLPQPTKTMDEGPPPPPPPQSKEIVDITDKIAKSECFVLNAVCF